MSNEISVFFGDVVVGDAVVVDVVVEDAIVEVEVIDAVVGDGVDDFEVDMDSSDDNFVVESFRVVVCTELIGAVDRAAVVVKTKLSFTQTVLRLDSPLASFHRPPSIEKNST